MPSEIGVRPSVNPMEDMLKAKFEKYAPEKRVHPSLLSHPPSSPPSLKNGNRQLRPVQLNADQLDKAYGVAEAITDEYAKTFSLGLRLMETEKQKAVWAIYVWCRRTDELVDGSIASHITPTTLNKWEERLDKIFEGYAFDALDATLADTAAKFPIGKQGFKDMIEGMRMDLYKSRYQNFEELKEYCYRVAGTVGLMTTPVMGISKDSTMSDTEVLNSAVALGIALQLTNILRDVGEDAQQRDRIYLPLDELAEFGLTEADILSGKVDDRWRDFMKFQIKRAREYFAIAKNASLDPSVRWAVWGAGMVYGEILDAIEKNDYDNLNRRAYVPRWRKFQLLPVALVQTLLMKP
eukprot:jgi/Bigna1/92611/estExt_fgenesh1_pm.C_400009